MKTTIIATFCLALASAEARDVAPVTLDSCVNWKFSFRKNLSGWRTTSFVIDRTLRWWFPEVCEGQHRENASPEEMQQFLRALPAGSGETVNLVYLASHQSAGAEWYFPRGEMADWGMLLEEARPLRAPLRIVLVDSCYASSVLRFESWRRFANATVFGSGASEDAIELDFHARQPLDLRRRYPDVTAWLQLHAPPRWDGKISLLGLVWVKTFLQTSHPPERREDWLGFFRNCAIAGEAFRRNTGAKFSSTISVRPAD